MKLFIKPSYLHIAWHATVKEKDSVIYDSAHPIMPETCVSTSFENSIFTSL